MFVFIYCLPRVLRNNKCFSTRGDPIAKQSNSTLAHLFLFTETRKKRDEDCVECVVSSLATIFCQEKIQKKKFYQDTMIVLWYSYTRLYFAFILQYIVLMNNNKTQSRGIPFGYLLLSPHLLLAPVANTKRTSKIFDIVRISRGRPSLSTTYTRCTWFFARRLIASTKGVEGWQTTNWGRAPVTWKEEG